ncbi:DUF2169 family type VI secretion system accessory protein [Herbaspirillum rubrisubalbicans]|uniref:DUF2169 family type VI secretion system accessory protein n=1 Tax=Herbaspirillum rubrisubalbicans TaxID=80842 RepID=UPI0015597BD9|nr:DUF2169 domain-containing protein [Herbaspirillum rubrisubalbicans]NQE49019.1 hypothetical protein [Herbaspirillum rubrisubalbicans]
MRFINHTPFPALAFGGVGHNGEAFHVLVLRQTFTWNAASELIFADEQQPLCEADEFFGDDLQGSVRQESDLCPYKPRCDVIINAMAYPPRALNGEPPHRFPVRVVVKRPDTPAPLPPKPQGLNPFMPASPEALAAWRAEVERAKNSVIPGERLIDKSLVIHGQRRFVKRAGLLRLAATLLKFGTLGIMRLPAWRLTKPEPAKVLPVRLEHAYGGQCRIDGNCRAASKVPQQYRLTQQQAAAHPEQRQPPVAHEALAANPVGQGWARDWYLDATKTASMSAPQIEHPQQPITLSHFSQARTGQLDHAEMLVAGLGIRPKGHPERARLAGTIDEKFINSGAPLPEDFDFAVWNAAWPDQQIEALQGDEIIELTNLCQRGTPGVIEDEQGNSVLQLSMPPYQPYVLVRFESGQLAPLALSIDTLIVEPDARTVAMVSRAVLPVHPAIGCLEARQMSRAQWQAAWRSAATLNN